MAKALYGTVNASARKIKKCMGVVDGKYVSIKKLFGVVDGTYKAVGGNQATLVFGYAGDYYKAKASDTAQNYSEIYTSLDGGLTWDITLFRAGYKLQELAWVNDRFFATMAKPSTSVVYFYSSPDGITWTLVYSYTAAKTTTYSSIFYLNGKYIALVAENSSYSEDVLQSTDGANWTKVSSASVGQTITNKMYLTYYGGRYYLAKAGNKNQRTYYSSNLSSWTMSAATETYPNYVWGGVWYNGKYQVAYSSGSDGTHIAGFGVYQGDSNLSSWTKKSVKTYGSYSQSYDDGGASIDVGPEGNRIYLSGCINRFTQNQNGLYYSTDGNTWTLVDAQHRGPALWHNGKRMYAYFTTSWDKDEIVTSVYKYKPTIYMDGQAVSTIISPAGHVMQSVDSINYYKTYYWLASNQKGE